MNEFDKADALLDAVRFRAGGDEMRAGVTAIPVLEADPILAGSILISWISQAVHAYAHAVGIDPVEAVDRLWTKPEREAS